MYANKPWFHTSLDPSFIYLLILWCESREFSKRFMSIAVSKAPDNKHTLSLSLPGAQARVGERQRTQVPWIMPRLRC